MSESVYELARTALEEIAQNENDSCQHITTSQYQAIDAALAAGEKAEKRAEAAEKDLEQARNRIGEFEEQLAKPKEEEVK